MAMINHVPENPSPDAYAYASHYRERETLLFNVTSLKGLNVHLYSSPITSLLTVKLTCAYQYIFTMSSTAAPPGLGRNCLRRPVHLNPHNVSPPVTLPLQHMQNSARASGVQAQAGASTNTSNTTSTLAAPHLPRARSNI
jgi:hypothetical protein